MEWLKKERKKERKKEDDESISARKTMDQNKMMSRTKSAHCQFT